MHPGVKRKKERERNKSETNSWIIIRLFWTATWAGHLLNVNCSGIFAEEHRILKPRHSLPRYLSISPYEKQQIETSKTQRPPPKRAIRSCMRRRIAFGLVARVSLPAWLSSEARVVLTIHLNCFFERENRYKEIEKSRFLFFFFSVFRLIASLEQRNSGFLSSFCLTMNRPFLQKRGIGDLINGGRDQNCTYTLHRK